MTNYEFVVFTDPQFGKTDKEGDGDGTDWSMDIENVSKMCSQLDPNLAFVMCAGDLGELSDWCFVDNSPNKSDKREWEPIRRLKQIFSPSITC